MGVVPSGPWRRLEQGDQPPALGDYAEVPWLYKYADLYRAMAAIGVAPPVVNAMTAAEASAYLGLGFGDAESPEQTGADTNRERMEYLYAVAQWNEADPATRGPEPTPPRPPTTEAPNPALLDALSG